MDNLNTLEGIERFLTLSGNNPEFRMKFDNAVNGLDYLYRNEIVDYAKYKELHNKLYLLKDEVVHFTISDTFKWFQGIKRHGYFNIDFTEQEFEGVMTARNMCVKFHSWADLADNYPDNPTIIGKINEVSRALLSYIQAKDERMWDAYKVLKELLISSISRGVVNRTTVSTPAEIVKAMMGEEFIRTKELERKGVQKMNYFGPLEESENKLEFDLDKKKLEIEQLYISNFIKFSDEKSKAHAHLDKLLRDGVLSTSEYDVLHRKLSQSTHYLYSTEAAEYTPIVVFYQSSLKGEDPWRCYVFNEDQINRAVIFANDFLKIISDDFIIHEVIEKKLSVNLAAFNYSKEIKDYYYRALSRSLNMLRSHGVLATPRYREYLKLAEEKFL